MRSIKKWGLMLVIAGVLACTGCGQNAADGDSQKVEVFTVGDESVYLNEVWVYAKTIQQEYEKNYGSGIWAVELQNEDGDTQTVETITKEDMIEEIMQVKVLVTKADAPLSETAQSFFEFATSPAAAEIISAAGAVAAAQEE